MKRLNVIATLIISFSLTGYAQQQQQPAGQQQQGTNQPSVQQQTQQQGTSQQGTNSNAGESTNDTPGAAEAAADANATNQGAPSPEQAVNTPAVPQTTTSQSGSPAVLSDNDGSERDGTNSVQRATPNMVGSPAGNLGLDQVQPEDANTEMADRQGYTQDKQNSEANRNAQTGGTGTTDGSGEINNKNRRENYEQSDQNLSAKERNKSSQDEDKKSDRKSRRKKDKG